jgi:hypothetical protein
MKWIDIKQTDRRLRDCMENTDRIWDARYSRYSRWLPTTQPYSRWLDTMMIDTDLRILAMYPMLYSMHDDYIVRRFK